MCCKIERFGVAGGRAGVLLLVGHGACQIYRQGVESLRSRLAFYPKVTSNSFERHVMVGLPSHGAPRKPLHCLTLLLLRAATACPVCYRCRDRVPHSCSLQGLGNCSIFSCLFPSKECNFICNQSYFYFWPEVIFVIWLWTFSDWPTSSSKHGLQDACSSLQTVKTLTVQCY